MNKKNKKNVEDKVTSWSEQIGASLIAILTTLGLALIVYTGVQMVTYETPTASEEYLTLEDVEVLPEDSQETNQVTEEVTTPQEEDVVQQKPEQQQQEEVIQSEEPVVQTPQKIEAICNIDGVNVRSEAATGTTIIGQLSSGEKVTVLDPNYNSEWIQVSYEGQTGYVYSDYLDFN